MASQCIAGKLSFNPPTKSAHGWSITSTDGNGFPISATVKEGVWLSYARKAELVVGGAKVGVQSPGPRMRILG